MEIGKQLYEGKAKKVFATDDEKVVLVDYKDDATAFNGLKKGQIAGKGVEILCPSLSSKRSIILILLSLSFSFRYWASF